MTQGSFFSTENEQPSLDTTATSNKYAPLAARMRPRTFDDYVGQSHLLKPGAPLRRMVENDRVSSIILWGPPGVGKTTLAEIIANLTHAHFVRISATSAGVADLRKVVEEARKLRKSTGQRSILLLTKFTASTKLNKMLSYL